MSLTRGLSGLLCLCAACAFLSPAAAQRGAQKTDTLEEIVVTATRVESILQQTPLSIQAFTAEQLELAGIEQGRDLGIMVPNAVMNAGGITEGASAMVIRGLPGVGVYVDGIYRGDGGFLQTEFLEVERVEVLRGPQGTLFGRNTNGGAIQIITRKPADEFGARVGGVIGSYGRRDLTLAVDLPVSESLKTKWTAASFRNDGFLESLSVPRTFGGRDDSLLRGDMLWAPSDRWSLRFKVNDAALSSSDARITRFTNTNNVNYMAYNVLAGNPEFLARARAMDPAFPDPPFALAGNRFTPETHEPGYPGGELGRWQTRSDTLDPTTTVDALGYTATLKWQITPRLLLESLTAHSHVDNKLITDFDSSEFTITTDVRYNRAESRSEELHLIGEHFSGRVHWLLGAYYSDVLVKQRFHRWALWEFAVPNTGPNPNPFGGVPGTGGRPYVNTAARDYVRSWGLTVGDSRLAGYQPPTYLTADALASQEDSDRALFGEVTIGLTAKVDLTLGFRVTGGAGESRTYAPSNAFRPVEPGRQPSGDLFAGSVVTSQDRPDLPNISTPRYSVSYRPTDTLYVYGSYAEGFTSGEVDYDPNVGTIVLDPEVIKTHEIGLRSTWLDRRLRFNATYFNSDWDGLRVPKQPPDPDNPGSYLPFVITTSAGSAEARGLEAEIAYWPTERWRLNLGIGLLHTAYVDLGTVPPNGTGLQPGIPFQYAPERSFTLGVQYGVPLSSGAQLQLVGSYGWMDEYQRAAVNEWQNKNPDGSNRSEPAYGLLNMRAVYAPQSGAWKLSLFATNLTDEWYVNGGFDARATWGYDFATIGPPREYGLSLQFFLQ